MLGLASEAGINVGTVPEMIDDPELGSHQASVIAPVGPHDKQRLLGVPVRPSRLALLAELLGDAEELLALQLGQN